MTEKEFEKEFKKAVDAFDHKDVLEIMKCGSVRQVLNQMTERQRQFEFLISDVDGPVASDRTILALAQHMGLEDKESFDVYFLVLLKNVMLSIVSAKVSELDQRIAMVEAMLDDVKTMRRRKSQ